MKVCRVYGTCENCGEFDFAIGADPDDARLMLAHFHNCPDMFEGETTHHYIHHSEADKLLKERTLPKRKS